MYLCHDLGTVEFPFWRVSDLYVSLEVTVVPGQQLGQPCPLSPAEFAVRLQHRTKWSSWLLLCFPTFLENLAECRAALWGTGHFPSAGGTVGFSFRALLPFVVMLYVTTVSTFLFLESSLTDRMLKTTPDISITMKLT